MAEPKFRILAVCSHAVQYMSPLLRRLESDPRVDLQVAYCSLRGAEAGLDPDFNTTVKWDLPLLDGYSWQEIPNRGSGDEGFFGLYNPGLWKVIRRGNFDAVLCFTGYIRASFWISYFAAKFSRAAFLFGCDQNSLEPRDGRAWKRWVKNLSWPILYGLADQVVVSSNAARSLIISLGIPEEDVTLTPLVVDNDWWNARAREVNRDAVRATWGAAPDTQVVLFCGKLQPWKCPLDLLHAFATINDARSLLVIAGEGPQREELQAEAGRLGVADRVRMLGFVNQSDLPAVYTSADVLVLPSAFEPFAAVVAEASCCGCPVIASDCVGAAPDLIAPVNPDFVFPAGNVDALTEVLRQAISSKSALAEFGRKARARMDTWSYRENIDGTVRAIARAVRKVRYSPLTADAALDVSPPNTGNSTLRK